MEKTSVVTRALAVLGATLAWIPLVAPVVLALIRLAGSGAFRGLSRSGHSRDHADDFVRRGTGALVLDCSLGSRRPDGSEPALRRM